MISRLSTVPTIVDVMAHTHNHHGCFLNAQSPYPTVPSSTTRSL
ncbi:MAG: hypothetical protein ABI360_02135 [Allobranchiibius sp.]